MKKRYGVLLILITVLMSCGQSTPKHQEEYENLRDEVLHEHDKIMEDLTQVNSKLQKLEAKADSTDQKSNYKKVTDDLKQAHQSMFDWMHGFDETFPNISDKNRTFTEKEYKIRIDSLKSQQNGLLKVKKQIENSLSQADSILKEQE